MVLKNIFVLTTLCFLSACGSERDLPSTGPYDVGCIHLDSEVGLNQDVLDHNAEWAISILDQNGVVPRGDFCSKLGVMPIHIRATKNWDCDAEGLCRYGEYFDGEVTLGKTTQSWLHEYLHAVDRKLHGITAEGHPDWEAKGYYAMDKVYKDKFVDPSYNNGDFVF